ncbi:arsenate reductase (glutaredoxin) [Roseovarius sp. SCSIO 43702]|uniref:arsenate reductase (glutaredoxin) n=1 Tax=Roseovarius sp. SCSIO 43702 TaxID=2823043 RepID=UPI001C7394BD|nr:arsenate reductase (glutaredoxin) [Roseovarius sp. SCSIO 43702]QYX56090.1 arsenate reductase (glutaredoxin) [Roseovarius sp. SCSIO 43702]
MSTIIWHNPRCSKSRDTLALLEARDEAHEVRRYLDDPPSEAELREVAKMLGTGAGGLLRAGEALARELGLRRDDPEDRLFAAMAAHPRLIERPVVIKGDRARLGRPPEQVLEIL